MSNRCSIRWAYSCISGFVRAGQLAGLIQAFQGFLAVFLVACDGMFASISRGNPSDGVTLGGQQLDERLFLFQELVVILRVKGNRGLRQESEFGSASGLAPPDGKPPFGNI